MDGRDRLCLQERLLVDLKGIDPRLIAAVIEVVKAAHGEGDKPAVVQVRTVGELWDEWAVWAEANLPSWRAAKTNGNNLRVVKVKFPGREEPCTVMELPWVECTPEMAEHYRTVRAKMSNGRKGKDGKIGKVSHSTINREIGSLQSMFNYHREVMKAIDRNPLHGARLVDERQFRRQTYLTPEQARAFIDAGPPLFQDICWTAYRCAGMRHSEARLLRKSEIDWEAKVINLPSARNKNREARVIPFPDDIEPILRRHCEISRGEYIFVSAKDPKRTDPVGPAAMQYWMELARKRSGIVGFDGEAVVIHSLRHAGVTRLVEIGAQESFIKAAAGMCDATLARYTKFKRPQQEALRDFMNKLAEPSASPPRPPTPPAPPAPPPAPPPQPITAPLRADRKDARRAPWSPATRRRRIVDET